MNDFQPCKELCIYTYTYLYNNELHCRLIVLRHTSFSLQVYYTTYICIECLYVCECTELVGRSREDPWRTQQRLVDPREAWRAILSFFLAACTKRIPDLSSNKSYAWAEEEADPDIFRAAAICDRGKCASIIYLKKLYIIVSW